MDCLGPGARHDVNGVVYTHVMLTPSLYPPTQRLREAKAKFWDGSEGPKRLLKHWPRALGRERCFLKVCTSSIITTGPCIHPSIHTCC